MAAPASAPRNLFLLVLLLLLLLLPPPPGAHGEVCVDSSGYDLHPKYCPVFCCGTCYNQYCCSDILKKFVWNKESCEDRLAAVRKSVENLEQLASSLSFNSDMDDNMPGFEATVAVGVTIFVLIIVTIIACFTCSCCCLYKMCCQPRPRPVVTTTSTTVVHTPYPQPPSVPPAYPAPSYQGYHPIPPQPGVAAAPYPAQYPPPYPAAQPMGPPTYHETLSGGAATPYPASQPPYNPAYVDPPKAAY